MARVRVSFTVAPKSYCENLYIVGSTSNLGCWDVKKATQLRFCEECQKYVVDKINESKLIDGISDKITIMIIFMIEKNVEIKK